jgi:hypothetical protein
MTTRKRVKRLVFTYDNPYSINSNFDWIYSYPVRCQLHCHSKISASDCDYSTDDLLRYFAELGYKFVAVTDHDVCWHDAYYCGIHIGKECRLLDYDDIFIDPVAQYEKQIQYCEAEESGMESQDGRHMVEIGLKSNYWNTKPFTTLASDDIWYLEMSNYIPWQDRINWVKEQGGLAIPAHPLPSDWPPNELLSYFNYDGIEIRGDLGTYITQWDRMIKGGKRILGYSVSDLHHSSGNPHNCVYAFINSSANPGTTIVPSAEFKQAVINALKTGNFYCWYTDSSEDCSYVINKIEANILGQISVHFSVNQQKTFSTSFVTNRVRYPGLLTQNGNNYIAKCTISTSDSFVRFHLSEPTTYNQDNDVCRHELFTQHIYIGYAYIDLPIGFPTIENLTIIEGRVSRIIALLPKGHYFGEQRIESESAVFNFKIFNRGNSDLHVQSIFISDDNYLIKDCSIYENEKGTRKLKISIKDLRNSSFSIPANGYCLLSIAYRPRKLGASIAEIIIRSDKTQELIVKPSQRTTPKEINKHLTANLRNDLKNLSLKIYDSLPHDSYKLKKEFEGSSIIYLGGFCLEE